MAKQEETLRSRNSVGFFGALTPVFYIACLVLVGVMVLVTVLIFRGCSGTQEGGGNLQSQSPMGQDSQALSEGEAVFSLKEKVVLPEHEAPARVDAQEQQSGQTRIQVAPGLDEERQGDGEGAVTAESKAQAEPPHSRDVATREETGQAPPTIAQVAPSVEQERNTAALSGTLWIVQLSVNRRADLAAEWAKRVNGLGLVKAYVLQRGSGEEALHVLRMGGFDSEDEAKRIMADVTSKLGLAGGLVRQAAPEDLKALGR